MVGRRDHLPGPLGFGPLLAGLTPRQQARLTVVPSWMWPQNPRKSFRPSGERPIFPTMTKLLEHAVDTVRALPPEVQDELARLLLQLAGEEQPVVQLTADERADLTDADAEIARGEFATDERIRAMLAKRAV
jgi:hypothetical protein